MVVEILPEAEDELALWPQREQDALHHAVAKLEALGDVLGFPHTSAVHDAPVALRELRPRGGDSPVRAFYRRVGAVIVIGSVGPEAQRDPRKFRQAVDAAVERLRARESRP